MTDDDLKLALCGSVSELCCLWLGRSADFATDCPCAGVGGVVHCYKARGRRCCVNRSVVTEAVETDRMTCLHGEFRSVVTSRSGVCGGCRGGRMSAAAGGRCGSKGDRRVKERESGWLVTVSDVFGDRV